MQCSWHLILIPVISSNNLLTVLDSLNLLNYLPVAFLTAAMSPAD
jgi:hypothetical protein